MIGGIRTEHFGDFTIEYWTDATYIDVPKRCHRTIVVMLGTPQPYPSAKHIGQAIKRILASPLPLAMWELDERD